MTEQEIIDLVTTTLATFKSEVLSETTKANQGLAASITKEIKKVTEAQAQTQAQVPDIKPSSSEEDSIEGKSERLSLKALQQQIKDLQTEAAEKDKKAEAADRKSAISSLIGTSETVNKPLLQKVFSIEYQDKLKKEGDQWFYQEGDSVKPLSDLFKAYLTTEEGKTFLPPSGVNGSGSTETKSAPPLSTNEPPTLNEMYAQLAGNLSLISVP